MWLLLRLGSYASTAALLAALWACAMIAASLVVMALRWVML